VVAGAAELFTFDRSFDSTRLSARGVTIAVTDGALDIPGTGPASDSGVIPPLPEKWWDLSRFRLPPSLRVRSLRARGGFTGDRRWRDGALAVATIVSSHGNPCTVRARTPLQLGRARSDAEGLDHVLEFTTVSGKSYGGLSHR
jgi:hypothetical protein